MLPAPIHLSVPANIPSQPQTSLSFAPRQSAQYNVYEFVALTMPAGGVPIAFGKHDTRQVNIGPYARSIAKMGAGRPLTSEQQSTFIDNLAKSGDFAASADPQQVARDALITIEKSARVIRSGVAL